LKNIANKTYTVLGGRRCPCSLPLVLGWNFCSNANYNF